jgi:hypothetical protein
MHFFCQGAWVREAGEPEFQFRFLENKDLADMCIQHWDGQLDLARHPEGLFKRRVSPSGAETDLSACMPVMLRVLFEPKANTFLVNKTFDDYRSFAMTAPMYQRISPDMKRILPITCHYHISVVVKLGTGAIHLYHPDTQPLFQWILSETGSAAEIAMGKNDRDFLSDWTLAEPGLD